MTKLSQPAEPTPLRRSPDARQRGFALLFVLVLSAGLLLLLGATLEIQGGWVRQNHRELLRVQTKAAQLHLIRPAISPPAPAAPPG